MVFAASSHGTPSALLLFCVITVVLSGAVVSGAAMSSCTRQHILDRASVISGPSPLTAVSCSFGGSLTVDISKSDVPTVVVDLAGTTVNGELAIVSRGGPSTGGTDAHVLLRNVTASTIVFRNLGLSPGPGGVTLIGVTTNIMHWDNVTASASQITAIDVAVQRTNVLRVSTTLTPGGGEPVLSTGSKRTFDVALAVSWAVTRSTFVGTNWTLVGTAVTGSMVFSFGSALVNTTLELREGTRIRRDLATLCTPHTLPSLLAGRTTIKVASSARVEGSLALNATASSVVHVSLDGHRPRAVAVRGLESAAAPALIDSSTDLSFGCVLSDAPLLGGGKNDGTPFSVVVDSVVVPVRKLFIGCAIIVANGTFGTPLDLRSITLRSVTIDGLRAPGLAIANITVNGRVVVANVVGTREVTLANATVRVLHIDRCDFANASVLQLEHVAARSSYRLGFSNGAPEFPSLRSLISSGASIVVSRTTFTGPGTSLQLSDVTTVGDVVVSFGTIVTDAATVAVHNLVSPTRGLSVLAKAGIDPPRVDGGGSISLSGRRTSLKQVVLEGLGSESHVRFADDLQSRAVEIADVCDRHSGAFVVRGPAWTAPAMDGGLMMCRPPRLLFTSPRDGVPHVRVALSHFEGPNATGLPASWWSRGCDITLARITAAGVRSPHPLNSLRVLDVHVSSLVVELVPDVAVRLRMAGVMVDGILVLKSTLPTPVKPSPAVIELTDVSAGLMLWHHLHFSGQADQEQHSILLRNVGIWDAQAASVSSGVSSVAFPLPSGRVGNLVDDTSFLVVACSFTQTTLCFHNVSMAGATSTAGETAFVGSTMHITNCAFSLDAVLPSPVKAFQFTKRQSVWTGNATILIRNSTLPRFAISAKNATVVVHPDLTATGVQLLDAENEQAFIVDRVGGSGGNNARRGDPCTVLGGVFAARPVFAFRHFYVTYALEGIAPRDAQPSDTQGCNVSVRGDFDSGGVVVRGNVMRRDVSIETTAAASGPILLQNVVVNGIVTITRTGGVSSQPIAVINCSMWGLVVEASLADTGILIENTNITRLHFATAAAPYLSSTLVPSSYLVLITSDASLFITQTTLRRSSLMLRNVRIAGKVVIARDTVVTDNSRITIEGSSELSRGFHHIHVVNRFNRPTYPSVVDGGTRIRIGPGAVVQGLAIRSTNATIEGTGTSMIRANTVSLAYPTAVAHPATLALEGSVEGMGCQLPPVLQIGHANLIAVVLLGRVTAIVVAPSSKTMFLSSSANCDITKLSGNFSAHGVSITGGPVRALRLGDFVVNQFVLADTAVVVAEVSLSITAPVRTTTVLRGKSATGHPIYDTIVFRSPVVVEFRNVSTSGGPIMLHGTSFTSPASALRFTNCRGEAGYSVLVSSAGFPTLASGTSHAELNKVSVLVWNAQLTDGASLSIANSSFAGAVAFGFGTNVTDATIVAADSTLAEGIRRIAAPMGTTTATSHHHGNTRMSNATLRLVRSTFAVSARSRSAPGLSLRSDLPASTLDILAGSTFAADTSASPLDALGNVFVYVAPDATVHPALDGHVGRRHAAATIASSADHEAMRVPWRTNATRLPDPHDSDDSWWSNITDPDAWEELASSSAAHQWLIDDQETCRPVLDSLAATQTATVRGSSSRTPSVSPTASDGARGRRPATSESQQQLLRATRAPTASATNGEGLRWEAASESTTNGRLPAVTSTRHRDDDGADEEFSATLSTDGPAGAAGNETSDDDDVVAVTLSPAARGAVVATVTAGVVAGAAAGGSAAMDVQALAMALAGVGDCVGSPALAEAGRAASPALAPVQVGAGPNRDVYGLLALCGGAVLVHAAAVMLAGRGSAEARQRAAQRLRFPGLSLKLALLGYQGLAAAAMRAVAAAEASTAGGGALGGGSTGGSRRGVTPTVPSERAVAAAVLAALVAVQAVLVALLRRGPPAGCAYREFSATAPPPAQAAAQQPHATDGTGRRSRSPRGARKSAPRGAGAAGAPRPDPPFAGRPAWQRQLVLPAGWWVASPDRLRFGALFGGLRGHASFWFAAVPLLRALALAAATEATRSCDVRIGVVVATLVLPLGAHALRRPLRTGVAHAAACAAAVLTLAAIGTGYAGATAAAPLAALAAGVTIAGSGAAFFMQRCKQRQWIQVECAATVGASVRSQATSSSRSRAAKETENAAPLLVVPAAAPAVAPLDGSANGDGAEFRVRDRPGAGQWYGQATRRETTVAAAEGGDRGRRDGAAAPGKGSPRRSSSGGSSGSSTRKGGGGGVDAAAAAPANPLARGGQGRPPQTKR